MSFVFNKRKEKNMKKTKSQNGYYQIILNTNDNECELWESAKDDASEKLGFELSNKQFALLTLKFWQDKKTPLPTE
tara:strand:+ start:79 stop:306 length:228 start_codon:yes stop_codon:yes gene_type:complete